jgi:phosphoribosyl 1,2-cyclic phosphate phosphodiesterase
LRVGNKSILIDTSPDLRQQALREKIPRVDAVLFTHPHADHVHGIDELRSYNFIQQASIPVFGNSWTCEELKTKFSYIFRPMVVEGGGIPQLQLNQIDANAPFIDVLGEKIVPLSLSHGSKECVGYRINSVAYITDCSFIPPATLDRIRNLKVLVLDCLRLAQHRTHFNLEQALDTVSQVKPKKTYLTHLGHEFDYVKGSKKLPKGVSFAYDGLNIKL